MRLSADLVPDDVVTVLRRLRTAGKQAFIAGGAVRDIVRTALGEEAGAPQDFDVATDALPEEVQRLFPRTAPTGIAHGTITVLSDSLANVTDEFVMSTGKQKFAGRNTALLVKRNGEWKWKSMAEAGWAGMGEQPQAQAGK